MTNPNSASSNPQSADLSQDILDKVNAHADRSIDRLFADIDELLKNDDTPAVEPERPFYASQFTPKPPLNAETPFTPPTYSPPFTPPNSETPFTPPTYSPPFTPPNSETPFTPPIPPSAREVVPANSETPFTPPIPPLAREVIPANSETPFTPPIPPSAREVVAANSETPFTSPKYFQPFPPQTQPQTPIAPPQLEELERNPKPSGFPLWAKVFLSIGFISIASSTALLWLIKEGKINLPSNLKTSWLPGETQSQISPEDAKFADYMRKSISKIESANTQPAITSSSPTTPIDPTTNPPTPVSAPTTATGIATPPSTEIGNLKTTVSLTKTMQTGDRIGATFQIGKRTQTVNVGDKIGTTGWSLLTVAENSIVVVKPGRENKSIAIGQKF